MEAELLLPAENHSYHDIVVYLVDDENAPAIVIGGTKLWEDSYVISADTALELAPYLLKLVDKIKGKSE